MLMYKSARMYRSLFTVLMGVMCLTIFSGCEDEPDVKLSADDIVGTWGVISCSRETLSSDTLSSVQFARDFRYYLRQGGSKREGTYSIEGNRITLQEYVDDEKSDILSIIEIRRVEKRYLRLVYDGVTYECELSAGGLKHLYWAYDTFTANGVPYNYMSFSHGGFVHVGRCWVTDSLVNLEVTGTRGGVEDGPDPGVRNCESEIRLNLNVDIHDYETAEWGTLLNPRKDYDADDVPLTYKVALPGQDPYDDSFEYNTYGYKLSDTDQGKIIYVDKWEELDGPGDYVPRLVLRFKDVSFSRIDDNDSIPEKMVITGFITYSIIDQRN